MHSAASSIYCLPIETICAVGAVRRFFGAGGIVVEEDGRMCQGEGMSDFCNDAFLFHLNERSMLSRCLLPLCPASLFPMLPIILYYVLLLSYSATF